MKRLVVLVALVGLPFLVIGAATASDTAVTRSQAAKSKQVLRFFSAPKHLWLSAPNRGKCKTVPWTRSCLIARERIRYHTRRLEKHQYGHMVEILNRGLAGTPMAGTGAELEQAGREHGIHPAFIAAIAGTESSFGAAMCGNYNAYGLANCSGIWSVPPFRSWADSYRFMGEFLAGRWSSATTTYDYHGYAACSACWGRKNAMFMRTRFGVGPYTRYP